MSLPRLALSPAERDSTPEPSPPGAVGLLDWQADGQALPPTLPDGTPWPRIAVLVVGEGRDGSTASSVSRQGYPADIVALSQTGPASGLAFMRAVGQVQAEFLLVLNAGDRLAPGALAALALASRLEAAEIVIGLRVQHDGTGASVDILSSIPCASEFGEPRSDDLPGGEVLLSRAAITAAGGFSPLAQDPLAELWPRLLRGNRKIARIGRPVLVRQAANPAALPHAIRIAGLNDTGFGGGAGIAHRRLIEAARFAGHAVETWRLNDAAPPLAAEWTERFPAIEAAILASKPDLVLAANIHGATRTSAVLARLHEKVPVAAVLHDLFLLTGRCAHPGPCRRIEQGCDAACPTPNLYPQLAPPRIAATFAEKRRFLAAGPTLLANSRWTEEQARHFAPEGTRIGRVALAFPTQVFRPPADKAALRRRLGLPEHDVLILFGAVIADQPDKGGADLVAACLSIARPGIGFVALGRIDDPRAFPLPNLIAPGPIADEAELAAWYGACDIHVTASRLETFGQTAVEAGLCGLPTLAYRLTGLTSAVIDGVSGTLVEPRPEALAAAIADLVANPERRRHLGAWGRIALESRHSHAASALSLNDAFEALGLQPAGRSRIPLAPEIIGTFASAARPLAGESGTVSHAPSRVARSARWAKQRIWGRTQPLWMRLSLYALYRARRTMGRGGRS